MIGGKRQIVAIATAALVLAGGLNACGRNVDTELATRESASTSEEQKKQGLQDKERENIQTFINAFNSASGAPIENQTEFSPKDEKSGHYRTEFRLSTWNDSVGCSATCGDCTVDIVAYGKTAMRIYADGPSQQVANIYRATIPIADKNATQEAIEKAIKKGFDGYGNGVMIDDTKLNPTIIEIDREQGNMMVGFSF